MGKSKKMKLLENQLFDAVRNDDSKQIQQLFEEGVQINCVNVYGMTAVHAAVFNNSQQAVTTLIEKGADVNSHSLTGETPLHRATFPGNQQAITILIKKGGDMNNKDDEGKTPLHVAFDCDNEEAVMLLLNSGTLVDSRDNNRLTSIKVTDPLLVVMLKIKGVKVPPHIAEDFNKLVGFNVSSMEQNVLNYSEPDLDDAELQKKLIALPQDFQCHVFHVSSNKLQTLPNLRKLKQFENLHALIIIGKLVHTLEGLPDDIKVMHCTSAIEVMAMDCFMGEGTYGQLTPKLKKTGLIESRAHVNLDNIKQPPIEIIKRGHNDVLQYYKRGHKVIHSRIRAAVLGETTAGKTSLVQSLIKGSSDLTDIADRTQVVDIKEWHISESQIMMLIDQGGHPIYQICNPYFITDRSTLLIAHKLSDPTMTDRTKQVFRHIFHQHQANKQVHFVLTHKDELTPEQCQQVHIDLQATIRQMISNEIHKLKRLQHSPDYQNKENLNLNLASCNKKLKSMQFFLVSSKSYDGVDELRNFLISNIEKHMVSIPEHWIEFYEQLSSSEKPFFSRSEIVQILKQTKGFVEVNETFCDNILTCLHYFVDCGLLLWHEHHHVLKDYFFTDLTFLIQIFKSLFHHDLKSTLKYDSNTELQSTFEEAQLTDTLNNYQQHGTLDHKLASFLWKNYKLKSDDEIVLIELIKIFHIFSEIHSKQENLTFQQYFVPWLVQRNTPPESLDQMQPLVFTEDTFTLALQCLFHNEIPLNVNEMFLVEIQRYAFENNYLGKRYAWADGLQIKVGPKEIIAFRDHSKASTFLLVKCKTKTLRDAWSSFKALYLSLVSILKNYPGVVRSLHTICGHCVLNNIVQPHTWLPKYVFPNKPSSNNESVTCEKDEDSEIPAALITYPADKQITSQIEAINKYIQTCHQQESNTDRMSRNPKSGTGSQESGSQESDASIKETRRTECGVDPSLQVDNPAIKVQLGEMQQQQIQMLQGISQQISFHSQSMSQQMSHQNQGLSTQMYQQGQVLSTQIHLQSGDASHYCLKLRHPVLKPHQEELIEHMNPSEQLINILITKCIINIDDKEVILKEKTLIGKTKQILIRVEQFLSKDASQVTEFIDALNECGHGNNFTLADKLKDTYNNERRKKCSIS